MSKKIIRALFITTFIVLTYAYLIAPLSSFVKVRLVSMDIMSRFIYKLAGPPKELNNIAVVSIDRESLKNIDQRWPWTRNIFADFILKLKDYCPKIVYIDFSFIGESEDKSQDDILAKAISKADNVLIPFYFDEKGMPLLPLQKFMEAGAGFGPVNKLRDIDLSVRDTPLVYFSPEGRIIDYSVELVIICKYLGLSLADISLEKKDLVLNVNGTKKKIPITKDGIFHINYLATTKDINIIPFWKVLNEDLEPEIFKDKLVIVGITDKAFIDTYNTPLGTVSGVEIILNTILTILSNKFILYVPKDVDLPIILLMALLVTLTVFLLPPWKGFFITLIEIFGYLALSFVISFYGYRNEIFSVTFLAVIIYITTKIYKFICLLEEQNISLQKALRDLRETQAELIESERLAAVGRFSAQLSHEINNPLCAIQNSINTVKYIIAHDLKIEKIKEISDRVSGEIDRLIKLTSDILGFTRPSKEELKPIDINSIISEVLGFYQGQLSENKIETYLNLDRTIPQITVSGDRMKQVFSNLILNSQEAMTGGGRLTISTQNSGNNYIEILFTDTGCGIPPDITNKIFEPFFTTKKQGKGTGLGLFTVRNIINGYGGSINVNSTVGKGTAFKIKLPVR